MCGVFGFISKGGKGPNLSYLYRIAAITESRGEDAFGLAWIGKTGGILTLKRAGAATDSLDDLDAVAGSPVVIGHCRWATHGSPDDNRNNHPHKAGRSGWLVHNGVVSHHAQLIWKHSLKRKTDCDSEVLGLLIGRGEGSLLDRAASMANEAAGNMAVLGIWKNPTRLLIVRDQRPLFFGEDKRGFYFASQPKGLPGTPSPFKDATGCLLTLDDGQLFMDLQGLGNS